MGFDMVFARLISYGNGNATNQVSDERDDARKMPIEKENEQKQNVFGAALGNVVFSSGGMSTRRFEKRNKLNNKCDHGRHKFYISILDGE